MRTNVVIDDRLLERAKAVAGSSTKRETIEKGLRLILSVHDQGKIRRFRGRLKWRGNLHRMRRDS